MENIETEREVAAAVKRTALSGKGGPDRHTEREKKAHFEISFQRLVGCIYGERLDRGFEQYITD